MQEKHKKRARVSADATRLEMAGLSPQVVKSLKRLGYLTLEQAVSAVRMNRQRATAYVGTDGVAALMAAKRKPGLAVKASAQVLLADYARGARLEAPVKAVLPTLDLPAAAAQPTPALPPGIAAAAVLNQGSADVNLIPYMPPVRDQGHRGTCVAHATCALLEYKEGQAKQANTEDRSEQYLYWLCKQHDAHPNDEGTWLRVAVPLLVTDGTCEEAVWPYNRDKIVGNEAQGPPPAPAAADAAKHKVASFRQLNPTSVLAIKQELANGRPVAVSLAFFDLNWAAPEIRSTGEITMPFPDDQTDEGHAVTLVGYEDLDGEDEMGGGRFILRNSWNSYWGVNCPYGTGYGTIPYGYISTYCSEAYVLD